MDWRSRGSADREAPPVGGDMPREGSCAKAGVCDIVVPDVHEDRSWVAHLKRADAVKRLDAGFRSPAVRLSGIRQRPPARQVQNSEKSQSKCMTAGASPVGTMPSWPRETLNAALPRPSKPPVSHRAAACDVSLPMVVSSLWSHVLLPRTNTTTLATCPSIARSRSILPPRFSRATSFGRPT